MELRITGRNPEQFKHNLDSILNVASIVCTQGRIPTEHDIKNAGTTGHYWYKEPDNKRFQLSTANDHWANIRAEGDGFIVIEFNIRYDSGLKKSTILSNLILAFFEDCVELN